MARVLMPCNVLRTAAAALGAANGLQDNQSNVRVLRQCSVLTKDSPLCGELLHVENSECSSVC